MASRTEVETLIDTNLPSDPPPSSRIRSQKHREVEKKIVEYATNIIKMQSTSGTTITHSSMKDREVGAIIIDDYVKNTGFTKTLSSTTLTFTDGTSLTNNQSITILLA